MTPNNSTARTLTEHQHQTGEDVWKVEHAPGGRPLCRWCKKEVPVGRRTFCGDPKCIEEWRVRNSQSYARKKVFARDHGICKSCGRDTEVIVKKLRADQRAIHVVGADYEKLRAEYDLFLISLVHQGFDRNALLNRCLWHMDHIIEVVNGGGTCGLDNYQTLCLPCHKEKTKKLARERASARAAARRQSIGKLL